PKPVAVPVPVPAHRPTSIHDCGNPELVGTGANSRASCWDDFGGGRGPVLVVVPAPPGGKSFAIGRYEVSNADFARYCDATRQCKVSAAAPGMPVTSVSIQEAQSYLAWLSRQSGATYRLPTPGEWTYAADAGTPGGEHHDANCEKPGVAATLLPIRSGEHNKWGLYNYVGNVQEWVRDGSGLTARGGDYTDSFSQCSPATSRPQSGAPDAATGFRVLRELK
ncbi:MAG: formylglycine-generating enzyme family protein, partial [Steroidobacteraceae bacterium]